MPVVQLLELLFNDIADEQYLAAAKDIGDDKGGQRWHEHHCDARNYPRHTQRENNFCEGVEIVRPKVMRRIDDVLIDFDECVVQRQNHEREKIVHHAEHNRRRRVDDI